MSTKKKKDEGSGVGFALTAIAAAAGAYFLYGSKDAKKNRKVVKGWALKAKGEVLEKIELAKEELTEENYHKIVDTVAGKYEKVKNTSADEISEFGKELKSHWKSIKKHLAGAPKKAKSNKK